ncbi:MAG: glycosyltransferase family 4 protein, partial [Candidatus Diapherotrites archaeon]|nr:glycosyltransferase family 4 protein [Candidatus Diapherotrites archaeon]
MRIFLIGQKGIPAHGGGIERHVEELATRLVREGHEVLAYARRHYTDSSRTHVHGVRVVHLPTLHFKHLDAIVHTLLASIHVLFQRADIIHYHAIGPASLLWIPRLLNPRATIVFTFHCQDYHHQKWNWFARTALRIGEAIGCRFAHHVITVSKTLTDYAWAAYQVPTTYIPNGAVAEATHARATARQMNTFGLARQEYVLAVARLVRHKGIHDLIAAYQTLSTKKKLVIVGDGAFTDDYVRELHTL